MKSKLKTFIVSLSLQVQSNTFAFFRLEVLFWDLTLDKKN